MEEQLTIRALRTEDIPSIVAYWLESDADYLKGMGVDLDKLPSAEGLSHALQQQLLLPFSDKAVYALIWELDGVAVGHCNVNGISYGDSAHMHLHVWEVGPRRKGRGIQWLKMSIPVFFEHLKLEQLLCEPYALNPAPHKVLERVGFEYVKTYRTVPGSICFEQEVKQWKFIRDDLNRLQQEN